MKLLRGSPPGYAAMMIMIIAMLATVCVSVYLFLTRQLRTADPGLPPDQMTRDVMRHKLAVLLVVMLGAVLLIMLFVIGSYLFMRIGREVSRKPVGGEPTEYSDAWSGYRVSDEEIAAATQEDPPDSAPPDEPDYPTDQSKDDSDDPGPKS